MEHINKFIDQLWADQEARNAARMKEIHEAVAGFQFAIENSAASLSPIIEPFPPIRALALPEYEPRVIAAASLLVSNINLELTPFVNEAASQLVTDNLSEVIRALVGEAAVPLVTSDIFENLLGLRFSEVFERMREQEEESRRFEGRYQEEERQQELLRSVLAKMGWYVHGKLSWDDLSTLGLMVDEGKIEEIEATMMRVAEEEFEDLRKKAPQLWPGRSGVILDALDAHERGLYRLMDTCRS